MMNLLVWNLRSVGNDKTQIALRRMVKKQKPVIIALIET